MMRGCWGALLVLATLDCDSAFVVRAPSMRVFMSLRDGTALAQEGRGVPSFPVKRREQPLHDFHGKRRRAMLRELPVAAVEEIKSLQREKSGWRGIVGLVVANLTMFWIACAPVGLVTTLTLSATLGGVMSLWTLQILHDACHGTLFNEIDCGTTSGWNTRALRYGSLLSWFGYYLYLTRGHLGHHVGGGGVGLKEVFEGSGGDFEDGDVLFVGHRMKMGVDEDGPVVFGRSMSVSRWFFRRWRGREGKGGGTGGLWWLYNACVFSFGFMFERVMLGVNEVVVALLGKNLFFGNKADEFHNDCSRYARTALAVRGTLWAVFGFKALLSLYVMEVSWSLPFHPCSAMFYTNHGSIRTEDDGKDVGGGECTPTSSLRVGKFYDLLTLYTNLHMEHHDFPTIPFHKLYRLKEVAPQWYRDDLMREVDQHDGTASGRIGKDDGISKGMRNIYHVIKDTFQNPQFYACGGAYEIASEDK